MHIDVAIIGSGPAGLCAAITLAKKQRSVVVLDEQRKAGGKLIGQLHEDPKEGWWIGRQIAEQMQREAEQAGVTFLLQREVWAIEPGWTIKTSGHQDITASYVILATGAQEKPTPVPGWTLPGTMAIGAAQVLNNYERVRPGKRIAIMGVDPLAFTVAQELKLAGAEVVGIFLPPEGLFATEKAKPQSTIGYLSTMAHLAPNPWLRLAGSMAKHQLIQKMGSRFYPKAGMKVFGVPLRLRQALIAIEGANQVEAIQTVKLHRDGKIIKGSEESILVDAVCISGGLLPLVELASSCKTVNIDELGGYVPLHSEEMETSKEKLYVCGNITGIEGAKIAMEQGKLAAMSIEHKMTGSEQAMCDVKMQIDEVERVRKHAAITFMPNLLDGRKKMKQLWDKFQQESRDTYEVR
ncbi:NAD(P)/FAD-dependent oxidoreductase [Geomicrobium sp. JCM 19038]|uniref:NAD(P)/FAD-dependent oxidoreductase n=1 Tax=Geomicrobium sp. JCM 19038 TaxID=1460635 RepID=UPI00045F110C|nr:NAD(P)/FAD-dependent oxidoreductase [Geomicrobium sp. JCM 19038]GAK07926.1 sarcosine oxidase alpha subunit [Geomicrobium sp. JCM 19038]